MSMLRRKRWRDLWKMRGQILAVALVAAVGVANLVMSRATLESLEGSRDRFYREYAFADAFADLKRAPESVARQLARVDGVAMVDTRVVTFGRAELPKFRQPIRVQAISLPEFSGLRLNRLHLRAGREPDPGERGALVVSDAFAEAHGLHPGAEMTLVLHGHRQRFHVTGIGTTPEFVAQLAPMTLFPDARRFAVVWISRPVLAAAIDMDGAFNSVALRLDPRVPFEHVRAPIDRVLSRYGGIGAVARADQPSHRYLSEEFRQLRTMARLFPAVFLGVAAFVLYVVLGRLVAGQREQIGTLRAFGFEPREIWYHYAGYALVTGLLGAGLGLVLGARLGSTMADLYREFYRLPFLDFRLSAGAVLLALAVSLGSALLGALMPVLGAARLAPAEAMRPEVPWKGTMPGLVRAFRLAKLSQAHRMIVRNMQRRPFRTLLTLVGLAFGTAVMMMGRFQNDAIDDIVQRQYRRVERQDIAVAFTEPRSRRVVHELAALRGVRLAEPERSVPVLVRHRSASYRTALRGLAPGAQLRRAVDARGRIVQLPPGGVVLTDYLAHLLGARPGDPIELEVLDGRRKVLRMPLAGMVGEPFGSQAYLPLSTLDRLLGEGARASGATLTVQGDALPAVLAALERRPAIAGIDERLAGIRNFYEGMAKTILTFTLIATMFGVVITAGVIYSSARVALSERARDLASLRILGFTEAEVSYLLLGELTLLTVLAVPLGFLLGHGLIALLVLGYDSDLFRIPHHVSAATYGIAGVTTLATGLLCGGLLWRRVAQLDLIGVLKARD